MDAAAEIGRNPVSTRFSLSMENEQADTGRGGRTRLARPNAQARTGQGKKYFPCLADHVQDLQPHPVDPYSATCDDHTYMTYILYTRSSTYFGVLYFIELTW